MRLILLTAALAIAVIAVTTGRASAYPQFQLATGTDRCQSCHLSPAGGGLINAYGRMEAGDTISRGGDGAFLHGLWEPPSWFQIGGDLRAAAAARKTANELEGLAFPMQLELYLRPSVGPVSLYIAAGLRGGARDVQPPLVERIASREHYLMYQKSSSGLYVRAGRFYPIFGVRTQDHTAYVRRYLDHYILEEPYGLGAGWFGSSWEAHATAFGPQPSPLLGAAPPAWGGTLYYERRIREDTAAWAAQAKVAITDDDVRATAGGVGKLWLEGTKLMLLAELNYQLQTFSGNAPARSQVVAYLGATYFASQGLLVGATVHTWEPDLTLAADSRTAADLSVQYFPWAHTELHMIGRVDARGLELGDPGFLGLIQLHYYL